MYNIIIYSSTLNTQIYQYKSPLVPMKGDIVLVLDENKNKTLFTVENRTIDSFSNKIILTGTTI